LRCWQVTPQRLKPEDFIELYRRSKDLLHPVIVYLQAEASLIETLQGLVTFWGSPTTCSLDQRVPVSFFIMWLFLVLLHQPDKASAAPE
jgi:hypothetical protein